MTLLNHRYENIDTLKLFLQNHALTEERFVLVQLFSSNQSPETMYRVRDEVTELIPNCSLIATSTAGINTADAMLYQAKNSGRNTVVY